MQYCSNCGTRLNEEAKFCPTCGTGVANFINAAGSEPKSDIAEPATATPNEEPIKAHNENNAAIEPAAAEEPGQPVLAADAGDIPAETDPQDGAVYPADPVVEQVGFYQPASTPAESSYYQSPAPQNNSSYVQSSTPQSSSSYYQSSTPPAGNSYYQQPPAQGGSSYYQQAPAQDGNAYYQGGGAPNYQGAPYGGAPNYQQPQSSGSGSVVAGVLFCIFLPLVGLIYTLVKKPFQKTGQTIAVIWCIVAMVLSILLPVLYYVNYYRAINELYNNEEYWDEVEEELDNIIIEDDMEDDVIVPPDTNSTYGDIPVQLSIFDAVTSDNILKAFDEIGLDVDDISSLVYDTDWEKGPVYSFDYKDATVDLYLYDDGKVYSIETAGTQIYLDGYDPWQIDDYIGGSSAPASSAPVSSEPVGVMPDNGYIFYEYGYDRVCPLTIITQGEYAYYIKLVDAYNGGEILTFFVQPGQTVDIDVPLGDFYIKYASGLTWYDETSLFGPDTAYSEAGDIFYFTEDEESYYGYTVELYMQEGGNLDTYEIEPGEF